jgi:hypothetical protein
MTLQQFTKVFDNAEEYFRFDDYYKIIDIKILPEGRYEVIFI